MLSVTAARARILQPLSPLGPETIALTQAVGRMLARAVSATAPVPAFNNSSMDGYAVHVADVAAASTAAPVTLPVSADVPAGSWPAPLTPGTVARIMTGAPVPPGADAVIPVEATDDTQSRHGGPLPAQVQFLQPAQPGAYIRLSGHDAAPGQVVLEAGTVLGPAQIGVLATLGQTNVEVFRRPRVAVFSTGSELAPPEVPLTPGQIRDSNRPALLAAVAQTGAEPLDLGAVPDDFAAVRAKLEAALALSADVVLSSAGVSVGAYDVVKAAVEALGALDFWRVNMRPGKPLAFGHLAGKPYFGLPGNPVSALVTFEIFVRPALLTLGGHTHWERPRVRARLLDPLPSDGRESYARVRAMLEDDHWVARSAGDQGSSTLTTLARANALLCIPAGVMEARVDDVFDVWLLQ